MERRGLWRAVPLLARLVLAAVVSVVMFAMMILTVADVAGRALFSMPIKGSFEIVTFLLAILIFAALPLITWDEKHISVTLFERLTSGAAKRALDIVMTAISTLVLAVIAYRLWIQADLMAEGRHVTGFLEWPIAPIAYFMSILSGFSAIILAAITLGKIAAGEDAPHAGGDGAA